MNTKLLFIESQTFMWVNIKANKNGCKLKHKVKLIWTTQT